MWLIFFLLQWHNMWRHHPFAPLDVSHFAKHWTVCWAAIRSWVVYCNIVRIPLASGLWLHLLHTGICNWVFFCYVCEDVCGINHICDYAQCLSEYLFLQTWGSVCVCGTVHHRCAVQVVTLVSCVLNCSHGEVTSNSSQTISICT